jgi:hypothetical protein
MENPQRRLKFRIATHNSVYSSFLDVDTLIQQTMNNSTPWSVNNNAKDLYIPNHLFAPWMMMVSKNQGEAHTSNQ